MIKGNLQELIKPVVRVGNSAGVILPREWLDGKARVELVVRPLNIKKDVLEILGPYLDDVIGVYIVGSYARNEETERSDVDILVISKEIKKFIISGKYEIEIIPVKGFIWLLRNYPETIYPKFIDAKVILNRSFLEEIRDIKLTKNSFKRYFEDTKRMIKIDREFIEMDKLEGDLLDSESVVYSSILRLRALWMIKCSLNKKKYFNRDFERWIISGLGIDKEEFGKVYGIYRNIRNDKKSKEKISIVLAEKLVNFLEKEADKYG